MATAKAERLLNLVIALVNSPRFRTASWIRDKVAGYGDAPTEEAFFRTFERDKTELRDLGIPLQTPEDGTDGYRIPPGEFSLPQLTFTPAEMAALGLAGRLWETTALGEAGTGALRKIRDAATDAEHADEPGATRSAVGLLQPRVKTGDPAFGPLYAAVQARRSVTFEYRKTPGGPAEARSVQPWGLVSYRGRWYLVGHDTERGARRTFRLSRIVSGVRPTGRAGSVVIPAGLDLLALVAGSAEPPTERTATLLIRRGRGAGLRRRRAVEDVWLDDEWDRVEISLGHLWETARTIAGNGPDVRVQQPDDLREAVIRLLTAVSEGARPVAGQVRGG